MSKLNQIQKALMEIDGARYQKLVESYLYKKRGFQNIHAIGSVAGRDKVKQGNPDILFALTDESYTFAECTTQQVGVYQKLVQDLDKDLDEEKTSISTDKIKEIIFCFTSSISIEHELSLRQRCLGKGISFTAIALDTLSHDLHERYPGIAKEFLGIEVDTNQILSVDDFIVAYGKHKLAAPLDTAFHFREEELVKVKEALETSDIVILSGRAGLGKSRLAIECCAQFKEGNPEYSVFAIFNRSLDLYEDIRAYFSAPGKYLILIDDANRLSSLGYFLDLLRAPDGEGRYKVIATVRDYATDKVRQSFNTMGSIREVQIERFDDKKIQELVADQYEITIPIYLERICKIAQGNPRLAIMAARLAVEKNTLESIGDVSGLYDAYFSSIREDLRELENVKLLKVVAIVSFFRQIDKTRSEFMGSVEKDFGISPDDFWEAVGKLHEMELVDLYENELVRVSDQVLATYLFYLAVFQEGVLPFGTFLDAYFPKFKERLRDSIYGVFNAFGYQKIASKLSPFVDRYWRDVERAGNDELLFEVMDAFWFLKETETLLIIKRRITAMPVEVNIDVESDTDEESTPLSPTILSILGNFSQADDLNLLTALGLIFDYMEKRPSSRPHVLKALLGSFGFKRHSNMMRYKQQIAFVATLWERAKGDNGGIFSGLYLSVADSFLGTYFRDTEANGRMSLTMYPFSLLASPEILNLRKSLWESAFLLYEAAQFSEKVLTLIPTLEGAKYYHADKKIIECDAECILPFMASSLSPENYAHCSLANDYLDLLDSMGVSFPRGLRDTYKNELLELSEMLALDASSRRVLHLSYEEGEKYRKNKMKEFAKDFDLEDYDRFLRQCTDLLSNALNREEFRLRNGILEVMRELEQRNPRLYVDVIMRYVQFGEQLQLEPFYLADSFMRILGPEPTHDFIWGGGLADKWKFGFFYNLPAESITVPYLSELYDLYATKQSTGFPRDLDYLIKYLGVDENAFIRIVDLILENHGLDPAALQSLSLLLNPYTGTAKTISALFSKNALLLKRIYFLELATDKHCDYDGHFFDELLNIDGSFLREYIDWVYREGEWPTSYDDARQYNFLWLRDDFSDLISFVVERIYEKLSEADRHYHGFASYLQVFFNIHADRDAQLVLGRQNEFIKGLIATRSNDLDFIRFLFSLLSEFGEERRLMFIAELLKINKTITCFENISLLPGHWGGSGSMVPIFQKRIDFLKSVLNLLHSVEFLEHRGLVEEEIRVHELRIEEEKRDNFLKDY